MRFQKEKNNRGMYDLLSHDSIAYNAHFVATMHPEGNPQKTNHVTHPKKDATDGSKLRHRRMQWRQRDLKKKLRGKTSPSGQAVILHLAARQVIPPPLPHPLPHPTPSPTCLAMADFHLWLFNCVVQLATRWSFGENLRERERDGAIDSWCSPNRWWRVIFVMCFCGWDVG